MRPPKQKSPKELARLVEDFNSKYRIGDQVLVTGDYGETFVDVVRYPASIMGGHTAVAWLETVGSYVIDRVKGLYKREDVLIKEEGGDNCSVCDKIYEMCTCKESYAPGDGNDIVWDSPNKKNKK